MGPLIAWKVDGTMVGVMQAVVCLVDNISIMPNNSTVVGAESSSVNVDILSTLEVGSHRFSKGEFSRAKRETNPNLWPLDSSIYPADIRSCSFERRTSKSRISGSEIAF
jgi:hypothetical protein